VFNQLLLLPLLLLLLLQLHCEGLRSVLSADEGAS
jgi:hypothetical protein